jgi:hypothetical protein
LKFQYKKNGSSEPQTDACDLIGCLAADAVSSGVNQGGEDAETFDFVNCECFFDSF